MILYLQTEAQIYRGYDLDLSKSRDVIGDETIRFAVDYVVSYTRPLSSIQLKSSLLKGN